MSRIKLINIFQKLVKKAIKGNTEYYLQDVDNLYPNRIKALIESSKTAFRASRLMSKFIVGEGLIEGSGYSDVIVDRVNNLTPHAFSFQLAKSISYQDGFFVHVSYGYDSITGKIVPRNVTNISFEDGRISNIDDDGYKGKLIVKDWNSDNKFSNKTEKKELKYYSFSLDQEVLISQIKDNFYKNKKNKKTEFNLSEAISSFVGQYYYYNPNIGEVYPLAKIHATQNDTDSEFRIGNYINRQLRTGFLGKTIFSILGTSAEDQEYMQETIYSFLGEESASDVMVIPVSSLGEGGLDDVISFKQIKPQFDEKFFEQTKKDVKSDIMSAFNNIPEAFISSSEGSLFGTSSDSFESMKRYYSEQNNEEREAIYRFWKDVFGWDVEFKTFGKDAEPTIIE